MSQLTCLHEGEVNAITSVTRITDAMAPMELLVETQVSCAECGERFVHFHNGEFVRTSITVTFRPEPANVIVNEFDPIIENL